MRHLCFARLQQCSTTGKQTNKSNKKIECPPSHNQSSFRTVSRTKVITPWRLTWKIIMEVWFRSFSFIFMGDGCRFQPFIFQGAGRSLTSDCNKFNLLASNNLRCFNETPGNLASSFPHPTNSGDPLVSWPLLQIHLTEICQGFPPWVYWKMPSGHHKEPVISRGP